MILNVRQSLTLVVFEVSGTGGAAWQILVGDTPSIADPYWVRTGTGDTTFNTGRFGDGTHYANLVVGTAVQATAQWNEQAVTYKEPPPPTTPPPPPPTTPPPPSGYGDGERIGYCTLKAFQAFGGIWYDVVHDDGSKIASGETYATAKHKAGVAEACKQAPAPGAGPAPAGITQAQLDSAIAAAQAQNLQQVQTAGAMLLNIISSTATTVMQAAQTAAEGLFAALESKLDAAVTRIETNLIDPIRTGIAGIWKDLGELWTAAAEIVQHAEDEAKAWRKGVLDLEGSLRAWVEKEILDLFWRALTAEKKKEA